MTTQPDTLTRAFAEADGLRSAALARTPVPQAAPPYHPPPSSVAFGPSPSGMAKEGLNHFTSWTYSCVRAIASRIAGQPVRLARRVRGGSPAGLKGNVPRWVKDAGVGLEPVERHPLLEALQNPNPIHVTWSLMFGTAASLELTGRGYWFMDREAGKPRIYPVPVPWTTPVHEGGRFYDSYDVLPPGAVEPTRVAGEDMVHFSYPDPADPLGVVSPFKAAAAAVASDEAIQTAQNRMFRSVFPGLAVILGKIDQASGAKGRPRLSEDQKRELISAVLGRFRGVRNFDEPIILDALIEDLKRVNPDLREMDFLESGKGVKERICQAFGVNPIILGAIEGANRASSREAAGHFADLLNPKLALMGQTLTGWCGPWFGDEGLVVYFDEVRPRDAEEERNRMSIAARSGAVTLNELRAFAGLPALASGGDELVKPAPAAAPVKRHRRGEPSRNGHA